ncbi:hypothetical protein K503DRAFT_774635, partial [Rhizopogon vinicolor AM-OR11-026]
RLLLIPGGSEERAYNNNTQHGTNNHVALNVLWVELLDLEPAFHKIYGLCLETGHLPVTVADWSVFDRYASRVQVLRDYPDFHADIFGGVDADFIHAIMIFAPKALHSPRLKVVHLSHAPDQIDELALSGLSHLQEVSLWLGSAKAFQVHISTLAILSIRSPTLTLFGNLVQHWVVPCRRLRLFYNFPETALAVERAWRELDNRVLYDGLEEFRCDGSSFDGDIAYALSFGTFTPLMRFSSLKIVQLPQFCTSLLDDDAIGSIVKSWPRLEHLELGTNHTWKTQPRMTFQGLVTVLSSCPNLKELNLVFDATKVDPKKSGAGVCNTNITTLCVGFSPIEQTPEVALVLSAILPCLTEIKVEKCPMGLNREASKYIGICNLVRKQEGRKSWRLRGKKYDRRYQWTTLQYDGLCQTAMLMAKYLTTYSSWACAGLVQTRMSGGIDLVVLRNTASYLT